MKNIDLNVGGIIGAIAAGGITAAVVFSVRDISNNNRGPAKLIIAAVVGGALAGNYLWSQIFNKKSG